MSLAAPRLTQVIAKPSGEDIEAQWENTTEYDTIRLQYHTGGAWEEVEVDGHDTDYTLDSVDANTLYTVRVRGETDAPMEVSDWSREKTATCYSDTLTNTVTFTDSLDDNLVTGDIFLDTVTFSDILTEVGVYLDNFTDTITFSDFLLDAQTLRTDFAYYLIDSGGNIYEHGVAYLGDAGESISSVFETKNTDFADQDMAVKDEFKEVFGARLHYKDLSADATVSISYSTNAGVTWYPTIRVLGTGAETTKSADFFFRATAHSFKFKIEHASADKDFQWSGLEIFYLQAGEFFEI